MTDDNKHDMMRTIGVRKVGLCDTVSKGDGGAIVDDMKSIYASTNGPGSGILDRPSLCVGVPAWDGYDEIGDRSGLELISSDSYYERFAKYYIRGSRLPIARRKTGKFAFVQDMFKPSAG